MGKILFFLGITCLFSQTIHPVYFYNETDAQYWVVGKTNQCMPLPVGGEIDVDLRNGHIFIAVSGNKKNQFIISAEENSIDYITLKLNSNLKLYAYVAGKAGFPDYPNEIPTVIP